MTFEKRKINKERSTKFSFKKTQKSKLITNLGSLFIIIFLLFSILQAVRSINLNWALQLFSKELPTDAFGHTNFLVLGVGGENHDGPNLTDTIIVASIDAKNGNTTLLSIPRDLYIKDTIYGESRINQVYANLLAEEENEQEALNKTVKTIENLTGLPIHYYAKVNFQALVDLVDTFNGVTVYVEEAINDIKYPKDGTIGYDPFYLEAGEQNLDGAKALKYARSRYSTSDFGRSERQQQLIFALKNRALEIGMLNSINKINDVLKIISKNVDTNITSNEILQLGSNASNFTKDKFHTFVIHDDPTRCGGLLYTPDQAYYQGAFVLVPAGGQASLNRYIQLAFNKPGIIKSDFKIQLLNGTKTNYLATTTQNILTRYCLNITRYGNGRNQSIEKTSYFVKNLTEEEYKNSKLEEYVRTLQDIIPGEVSFSPPSEYLEDPYTSDADVIIELGADYLEHQLKDPFLTITDQAGTANTSSEDDTADE